MASTYSRPEPNPMYLSLRDVRSGTVREFELPEVRLGRDPA